MGLGALLIPALSGYWFLTQWHFTRYIILRQSGYHIVFQAALIGLALFIISRFFVFFLHPLVPHVGEFWQSFIPVEYSGTLAGSVLLGFVLPYLLNLFCDAQKGALRAAEDNGDLLELLIKESYEREIPVELSLRSRKSYIGFALRHKPTVEDSDIALILIASGYRSKDTYELKVTTNYAPAISEYVNSSELSDQDIKDFRIVIPRAEIMSARLFYPDLYKRFQTRVRPVVD